MRRRGLTPSAKWAQTRNRIAAALLFLLAIALLVSTRRFKDHNDHPAPPNAPDPWRVPLATAPHPTLVIYILSLADVVYLENYYFFLHEEPLLPSLPPHARYVVHDRACGGLSLVAWHLRRSGYGPGPGPGSGSGSGPRQGAAGSGSDAGSDAGAGAGGRQGGGSSAPALPPGAPPPAAERFVLLSSAVRGPFIPPGLRNLLTWHVALAAAGAVAGGGGGGATDSPSGAPSSATSAATSDAWPDIAAGLISCAQPQPPRGGRAYAAGAGGGAADGGGGGGAGGPGEADGEALEPPFPEFTAISASKAAIDLLLSLPELELSDCPVAAEEAAEEAGVRAAGRAAAAADGSPVATVAAADPAAVLAADGLTAAEAAAMAALRAWSRAALGLRPRPGGGGGGRRRRSGLRLGSLLLRQRGVEWADPESWGCNGGVSPLPEHANDGISLTPYEIMFVPVNTWDDMEVPFGTAAEYGTIYTEWMREEAAAAGRPFPALSADLAALAATVASVAAPAAVPAASGGANDTAETSGGSGLTVSEDTDASPGAADGVASPPPPPDSAADGGDVAPAGPPQRLSVGRNRYYEGGSSRYKLPAVLLGVALGPQCFDDEHFRQANPDLGPMPGSEAWKFWVFVGQFQPRAFQLRCGVDWARFGLRGAAGQRAGGEGAKAQGGGNARAG
ncbi:hypothetical protein GPECTOR_8g382 [Gonium pectorale]|uniref:Uncharacterized protein n=1 Tax=Gonium pectorale TaxID=33097 RepID=A0A150GTB9_GONPE|nr:hypothetical protein GPECTOR_8g382 [Gonium pectorale]|eukprot:KXZ53014.1 hypothetical protein GPECTOR_8g382 [Gonium pectorale]